MPATPRATTRRITSADVAREAGVSRATVGFVLNRTQGQTISLETQQRVLAAAERLGYRPNEAARHLARGRTMIVLMVLPDWPMEHSMQRNIEAATATLERAGYTLITHTPPGQGSRPLWETLSPDVVIGMTPFADDMVRSMQASGVRHILPAPSGDETGSQAIAAGSALQVQHLVELGHRRLGYALTSDPRLQDLQRERLAEAQHAAAALGVELEIAGGDASDALSVWKHAGCTGIVAYNDEVAARVLRRALVEGVKVPDDLSIIGHDDTPMAELLWPSLSSIRQDYELLGRMTADSVLAVLGEETTSAEPEGVVSVIQRESTEPPTA